jgi:hypothetical protein
MHSPARNLCQVCGAAASHSVCTGSAKGASDPYVLNRHVALCKSCYPAFWELLGLAVDQVTTDLSLKEDDDVSVQAGSSSG